jgi:carbon starvation protein
MNALSVAMFALLSFISAYYIYGRFISEKIFSLDPSRKTPAHEFNDGVDYVPSRKIILFGHHFASIAGLGPIMGPAIGVIWGWLPAFIWVVLGSIFIGGFHDLGALVVSLRHKGKSIGEITENLIGPRARSLFLIIIFFSLSLGMGGFVLIISILFTPTVGETRMYPEAVIPIFSLMFIAVLIGLMVYKWKINLTLSTLIGITLMFFMIWVGSLYPVEGVSQDFWIFILLIYAFIASVLPVWLLLQPRDYLNSYQLFLGIALIFAGILIYRPTIVAPVVNNQVPGLPSLFPFLFITIACGAVSGFHSLVSSGTTAKQLYNERDARLIGYGAMLTEGLLAVLVIIACTASFKSTEAWNLHFSSWDKIKELKPSLSSFVEGAGLFVSKLGINPDLAKVFVAVMVVSFAMTSLDSATRLLRYNLEEIGESLKIKLLSNRYVSSFAAVLAISYFALLKIGGKPAGMFLWQLFGITNQLLAGLALLAISVYLFKKKKKIIYSLIPMVIMMIVTITAMVLNLQRFWATQSWALLVVGTCILGLSLWLAVEAGLYCWRFSCKADDT